MSNTKEISLQELDQKVDLILEYVNQQRLKSEAIDDLVADASIIGKDIYNSTVEALDDQNVEIHPEEIQEMGIRLLRNIKNINMMLDFLESMSDLSKDIAPIANEVILDGTKKLHEFEQKGYFEFIKEIGRVVDNIVTHFSTEDIGLLADNIVTIMETVKNITQPDMMKTLNNLVNIYGSMNVEEAPQYSVFKLMREMNNPEMKQALGFFVMFMKNLSNNEKQ
ncbi:MAG: DUF1641 domain-containing protein [Bacteroidales bacterium]|jgi:uncharacterized protein YjgD (DUF1641 family)|nr:DUF1641 domain-containing protein [Bacteroidales bacterium]